MQKIKQILRLVLPAPFIFSSGLITILSLLICIAFSYPLSASTTERYLQSLHQQGKERVIVQFTDRADPDIITAYGGKIIRELKITNSVVCLISKTDIELLKQNTNIADVIPDAIIVVAPFPKIPLEEIGTLGYEGDVTVRWNNLSAGLNSQAAWYRYDVDGTGVKIAILDTGINYTLENLDDNYLGGYDFANDDNDPLTLDPDEYHGTEVASILLGEGVNKVVGVSYNASYYALRVLQTGFPGPPGQFWGWISDFIDAIYWASETAHKADIISMSIGNYNVEPGTQEQWITACNYAYNEGILLIAGSGNAGLSYSADPAAFTNVMSVGAHREDKSLPTWSNEGVDCVAPGSNVYTVDPCNQGWYDYGTSMATPHVSGLGALMLHYARENNLEVNNGYMWETIKHSAVDMGGTPEKQGSGKAWAAATADNDPNQGALDLLAGNWPIDYEFSFSGYDDMDGDIPVYHTGSEVNQSITLTNITDVLGNTAQDLENLKVTARHVYADLPGDPCLPGPNTTVFTTITTLEPCEINAVSLNHSYQLAPDMPCGLVKTILDLEFTLSGNNRVMKVTYNEPDSFWYAESHNDIAPFHCCMESTENIEDCNGVLSCDPNFTEGTIGNAAYLSSAGIDRCVAFTIDSFDKEHSSGSISLSFKTDPCSDAGGIWQIGSFGDPNSLALFYKNDNDLYLEIKKDQNTMQQAVVLGALSSEEFTHILATWDKRDDTYVIKLFVNGQYNDPNQSKTLYNAVDLDIVESKLEIIFNSPWIGSGMGTVDEVSYYDWALVDPEVYPEYVYANAKYQKQESSKPVSTGPVRINSAGKLQVNGEDFLVKGVGYQPLAIGMENNEYTLQEVLTDPCIIARDIAYLADMNVNTVRLWAKLSEPNTLLDELHEAGIYAILGIGIPHVDIDYADPCDPNVIQLMNDMEDYVKTYRNHPAVLAWALGNEVNINYPKEKLADWYKLANELANLAYCVEGESYHPAMIINAWTVYMGDIDFASTDPNLDYVDMWGLNLYTHKDYHEFFHFYDKLTAKPLVVTEFGIDAYNIETEEEYQDMQAEWVVYEWEQIKENSCGGTVMEYCDEWWKGGYPNQHDPCGAFADTHPDNFSNEEYYGIMAIEKDPAGGIDIMHPREVYCALQQAFSARSCIADLTNDGIVSLSDLARMSCWWLQGDCFEQNCCGGGSDLNHDGEVDLFDFNLLVQYWLME